MKSLMRPGTGRQMRVNQPENCVACRHVVRDHANGEQVVDLVERDFGTLRFSERWR